MEMPRLYLMAVKDELADAFARAFAGAEDVEIVRDDFVSFMGKHPFIDGVVSPANSFGLLSGGFDKALRDYFGMALQDAVQRRILTEWFGEQTVGTSMAVDIPGYPGKTLFHTPVMRTPSVVFDGQTVYLCMRSALMAAIRAGVQAMVVPAFGGGTGRVPEDALARNMRSAYDQIRAQLAAPHMDTFRTAAYVIRSCSGKTRG